MGHSPEEGHHRELEGEGRHIAEAEVGHMVDAEVALFFVLEYIVVLGGGVDDTAVGEARERILAAAGGMDCGKGLHKAVAEVVDILDCTVLAADLEVADILLAVRTLVVERESCHNPAAADILAVGNLEKGIAAVKVVDIPLVDFQ